MRKKVYIAGKVTGEPYHSCTMKFGAAQKEVEALGFEAVNPLSVVNDWHMPWHIAMRKCIAALMGCDYIYLLPCHVNSKGARVEKFLARITLIQSINIKPLKKVAA